MKSGIFLIDGVDKYSYQELISEINSRDYYYPFYREQSLYNYWVNLIVALCSDGVVTLIDSDMSGQELNNSGISRINERIPIPKVNILDFEDLIKRIKNSISTISLYTSGTTGQPKKVIHSIDTLARGVKIGEKYKDAIWGFAYNPTHMAGLQVFFQGLFNGNALINIFNKDRSNILDFIERYGITHISATPTFYRLLLPYENEYKSVRRITLGGEKSGSVLYTILEKIFPNSKITNVYASTEAGTLFASRGDIFTIPSPLRDKIKVIDGELYIHSSLLGTSITFKFDDDFYATGDLIEWIDEEKGLFRFKGRKNELINVGGYKVNPQEVEDTLRGMDGIRDVYVYGRANSVMGSVLCADILTDGMVNLTEPMVKAYLRDRLQDYKLPRRIKFVESLSVTRTGKMSRK